MKTKVNSNIPWNNINWKNAHKKVFNLQRKIYHFSKLNDIIKVHKYQKLLINSFKSKLLAVRHVTQDNRGKKTARVDGVKSIQPNHRWALAQTIKLDGIASPIRRVYIPKKDGLLRPLGIPTLTDRVKQKLVLLALEPQWEAKFDQNSYGFRPGRCAQDAMEAVYKSINRMPKYVLDADIEKCFDKISHKHLLKKLNTYPTLYKQIKNWLKAGVLDEDPFNNSENTVKETLEGTPQGGVISPLLANIALDGMEKMLKIEVSNKYGVKSSRSLAIIKYADDIVIIHPKLEVIIFCKDELSKFLKNVNLKLNKDKSQIVHTLNLDAVTKIRGFEFLGFHVRQLPIGRYKYKKQKRPYRTLIIPSRKSVTKHTENLKKTLKNSVKCEAMISQLNPKIIGWANYYRCAVSADIFNYIDHKLLHMLLSRLKQIHKKRSMSWVYKKYFARIDGYKWTFYYRSKDNNKPLTLARHSKISILRHIKIKGDFSIYDDNLTYWVKRLKKFPNISNSVLKLLKKQKSKCALCSDEFRYGDVWEIDHITPLFKGGKKISNNIQRVHGHCHHKKTSIDKFVD